MKIFVTFAKKRVLKVHLSQTELKMQRIVKKQYNILRIVKTTCSVMLSQVRNYLKYMMSFVLQIQKQIGQQINRNVSDAYIGEPFKRHR